ncbi:hypothetical protein Tdes44962_MAKER05313 [Teratosphaeria destructans]|uniref:Uncharacterized protein n=1 Tax=Teratosphaeria destructans TaxID=418781 RepID=A0A9W7SK49_9PEZI|nr:hypothetical protein Tdes44962_MAKER05313 [Teratosphaeria destructans]
MLKLPRPRQQSDSGSSKASMIAEGCDSAAILILEELQIQQRAIATWEAREDGVPAALALVACGESVNGTI